MSDRRRWLITGAGRGLGRALTLAVLATGDAVCATVRGEHDLPEHDGLVVHRLDVRDRAGAAGAVARTVEAFGRLDVLVNNAGYGLIGAVEEVTEDEARAIVDTDLLGPLWLTQAALPVMRARGRGHIVQISTVGAVGTMPTLGLYNAAKWGLEGFSEALAAEVARFGIRVTLAELGETDTEWGTSSMRYSATVGAYDPLREDIFGTAVLPPAGVTGTGGGTPPATAAAAIIAHVDDTTDERLRLLVGDDAVEQVRAVLQLRRQDYERDPRFRGP